MTDDPVQVPELAGDVDQGGRIIDEVGPPARGPSVRGAVEGEGAETRGSESPEVVLVFFCGFQSRYCALTNSAIERIRHDYADELQIVFKPLFDDEDPFESSQVDCLIVNPSGIYGLYSLRSVQQYSRFYAFGSGYKFALGAMRAVYETAASAKEVAQAGLDASVDFDDGTAPPLEIISVTLAK